MELIYPLLHVFVLLTTTSLTGAALVLRVEVSVDRDTCGTVADRTNLYQYVKRRLHTTPPFQNLTGEHCGCDHDNSGIVTSCLNTRAIERLCFQSLHNNFTDLTTMNDDLKTAPSIDDLKYNGGYVCGRASYITRLDPDSEAQSNTAALAGGIAGGLAGLAALIVGAALLARKLKKKKEVDDVNNAASASGVTTVMDIEEGPNSVPPAGTG